MTVVRYTLISDGSSDETLLPILNWLTRQHLGLEPQGAWADFRRLNNPPSRLSQQIVMAIKLYPCEILFIHRDAEREPRQIRVEEINQAVIESATAQRSVSHVAVIPVRMTEAWLLLDERAIRLAAGNPNGRMPLEMPSIDRLESLPDPKENLFRCLRVASGLRGRRLDQFRAHQKRHLVADHISDFSPLQRLSAFRALADDLDRLR